MFMGVALRRCHEDYEEYLITLLELLKIDNLLTSKFEVPECLPEYKSETFNLQ